MSAINAKHKDTNKEEKQSIYFKVSTSKFKVEEDKDDPSDYSSKEADMRLFVNHYNKYMRKNGLKYSNMNLIKFRKLNTSNKWDEKKKEEKQYTCLECGKIGHYKNDCPSLTKSKEKKPYHKSKIHNKRQMEYIAWEEDEDASSSPLSSDEGVSNLCLMA